MRWPVSRLESPLVQDVARHGLSCNMAQVKRSDKHLRLNEMYEHWQEKHLHVRYYSLSPKWAICACPSSLRITSWKFGL